MRTATDKTTTALESVGINTVLTTRLKWKPRLSASTVRTSYATQYPNEIALYAYPISPVAYDFSKLRVVEADFLENPENGHLFHEPSTHTQRKRSPRNDKNNKQEQRRNKKRESQNRYVIQIADATPTTTTWETEDLPGPRDLNRALQRPKYLMPTLEEILPRLSNTKVFSTLDAKDAFYQIGLDEESSKTTTFWTPFGRYRYLRMPFVVSVAPEEFECKLHEKLDDLPGIVVIRDDVLVTGHGETYEEAVEDHDQNLVRLLDRAKEVNLKLNKAKMKLRKAEVEFT